MKKLFTILFFLSVSLTLYAQLDTKHYIPPMYARQDPATGSNEDIYLVLSTPQVSPFDVTITDGAGAVLYTGVTLSRSAPVTLALSNATGSSKGNGTRFLVPAADLATVVSDEGIILSANKAFFVNLRVDEGAQAAALTTKGLAALGTEFRSGHVWNNTTNNSNVFNRKAHVIGFIAAEDDTEVTISEFGSVDFENINEAAQPVVGEITVTLNEGQSYVLAAHVNVNAANINDVNGTRITSTKPIAVNSGSWLGGNPIDGNLQGRDIGIDQIATLEDTGFEYILVKGPGVGNESAIVIASIDGTKVYLNGSSTPTVTLNGGEFHRFTSTDFTAQENMHISSNQPVYVYQNINGSSSSNERQNGLVFVPPIVCLSGTNVDIADADFTNAFGGTINGTILIIGEKNVDVTITDESGSVTTLTDADAQDVTGNSSYVTYKETGYSGNITIESVRPIRVALTIESGNVGAAGFFSGFTTGPVIESPNGYDAVACIPENVPVELTATGFDSYQWFRNEVKLIGETNASLFVSAPGSYTARGVLSGCESSEQSFELEIALCPADVGIAKNEVSVDNVSGSIFDVTYDLYLENFSLVNDADNVQVIENIMDGLPSGATATLQVSPQVTSGSFSSGGLNPAFDGDAVTQMLLTSTETKIDPANKITIRMVVRIDMSSAATPTYTNQAVASTKDVGPNDGSNPDQQDFSTSGTDPDPDGNGDPTDTDENETTQTCLSNTSISYNSSIYYTTGSDPTPSVVGFTGGDFTAPNSQITINSATGTIDLSKTIIGTYTITYSFGGLCPVTADVTIALNPPAEPTVIAQTANNFTPIIMGSAVIEAGQTLFVTVEGETYELGVDPELTISGTTWSLDLPASVITGDGTYNVNAVIDDGVGGTTPDTTNGELIIDSSPPTIDIQGEPSIVNSTDPYTVTFEFSEDIVGFDITDINIGNGSTSNLVKVDDNTYTVVVTPDGTGDITIDVPSGAAQDAAGNTSSAATQAVTTYDDVPPTTPTTNDQITNDTSPVITGTTGTGVALNAGETMSVIINGATYAVTPDASGEWSLNLETATPTSGTLGSFTDGTYEIVTSVTDAAGNVASDTSSSELEIDTIDPTVPVANSQTTNDTSPVISGSSGTGAALPAGETMSVEINGATYSVIPDASGNWIIDLETATPTSGTLGALVNGVSYDINVTVEDAGGNTISDASSNELTIDTTAPLAPTVANLAECVGTDPVVQGTSGTGAALNAGEVMEVEVNGATYAVVPDASGDWTINTSSDTPSSGTLGSFSGGSDYTVTATVTDNASNESNGTGTVSIISIPTIGLVSSSDPTSCSGSDGMINLSFSNVPNGTYTLTYLDAGASNQTFVGVVVNAGAATINVGTGTYNDISLSVSGCPSTGDVDVILSDPAIPTIAVNSTTDPTACGGTGTISLSFTNVVDGSYTINHSIGTFTNVSVNSGSATIVSSSGTFTDLSIAISGCTSVDNPDATLADPTPPTIALASTSNPTNCDGSDGSIEISGLEASRSYTVAYSLASSSINTTISSNGAGNLIIAGLTEGDVSNISVSASGCSSNTLVGPFTLSDPVTATIAIQSSSNPTTCIGVDGEIILSGLENSLTYELNYKDDGVQVTVNSISSEANGTLVVSGLSDGNYTDFQVTKNSCTSNLLDGPVVLADPTPPTISSTVGTDPSTCTDTNGSIDLNGLNDADAYNISYTKDGSLTTLNNVNSTGGTYIITGLTAGSYTNISVVVISSGCQSNIIASLVLNPPDIVLGTTSDPTICSGSNGSIQITGLAANTSYDLNYELDGVAATANSFTADANGEYILTGIVSGAYTLMNVTNSGCVSNDLSATLSDPTPPTIVLGTVQDPSTCGGSDGSIQITGLNASTLYTVRYFTSGSISKSITSDGSGSLNITDLSAEEHTAINVSIDGCTSNSLSATLDNPAAPTVTLGTNSQICFGDSNAMLSFTGATNSPDKYQIDFDATAESQGFVDVLNATLGTSPINISVPTNADPAVYNGVFTVLNSTTGCGTEYAITVSVNSLPTEPTVDVLTTNNSTPTITGTADATNTVNIVIAGATYNTVANASGIWSIDTGSPDSGTFAPNENGINEVSVTVSDGSCDNTDGSSGELTIDTMNPSIPTVASQITNDTTPVLTGTAEAGSTVTVEIGGATYTVTTDASGNWSVDTETAIPTSGTFVPDENGSNEVVVTSTDAAGNTSTDTTTDEITIDTTAPAVPVIDDLNSNDTTPVITGTGEVGSTITVVINGTTFETTVGADGTWSIDTENDTPTAGGPFTPLIEGDHDVSVTSTDAAGNTSTDTTTDEITIDTTDPAVPVIDDLDTNDTTPVITGTGEVGSTITVVINGTTFETTVGSDGTWSIDTENDTPTAGGPFTPLTEGDHDVSVTSTDAAGNTSTDTTTDEVTVDLTDPVVPTVDDLDTNDTTPVITGTGEVGSTITIVINGTTFETTVGSDGTWSIDTENDTPTSGGPFTPLTEGAHDVSVTSTDAAGNTSTDTSTDEITVDLTDPVAPTVDELDTSDTTPVITGTGEVGSTITVVINGTTFETTVGSDGTWSIDTENDPPTAGGPFTPLTEGDHDVSVTSTDAAGNTSTDTSTDEITVDLTDPVAPTVDELDTSDTTPVITGTGEVGSTITVVINGTTFETTVGSDGTWSIDTENDPPTAGGPFTPLTEGDHDVSVTSTDAAGNTSTDTTTDEVTINVANDTDGDGINDDDEDTDGDGDLDNDDCDNDGVPNYLDPDPCDTDGDGILDDDEDTDGDGDPYNDDCDEDGLPNFQDTDPCDTDGDGLLDGEDSDQDGDPYNDDCDGDGIPNFQDSDPCDTDGDGITDNDEDTDGDGDPTNDDCDNDGIPNYQDADVCDTDGDGINDDDEDTDGDGDVENDDCDGDGTPNYQDTDPCDTDGDGILDDDEDTDGDGDPYNDDCDEDGIPNFQDAGPCDSDGDGLLDGEDSDQDGDPYNDDCDGDGIPNFQDSDPCDTDGDGITDNDEDNDGDGDPTNDDCDGDGIPDYQDADVCDTDGDGINDDDEDTDGDGDPTNDDCDGDGVPNFQDTDPCDTDGDGILDDDEDTDGDGNPYNDDCDGDGIPNFQDTDPCDSDGDGLLDGEDSDQDGDPYNDDCDGDGIPNFQDSDPCDTDGDGITDNDEDNDGDGDPTNDDCDGDGTPDYQDADICDTDGDGINDGDEDTDGDGDPTNDDCDGDGTPNFQDTDPCDTDGDGLLDGEDTNGDGNPYNDDCDGDGIPNFQDSDPCDTDGDGINDNDEDTDGDGDPSNDDCDSDGTPNYQDTDPCDTDGDGLLDGEDSNGDGNPYNDDCDGDGVPNFQDSDPCDTDGDGINDNDEDTDGDGDPTNDDCDGDGTPNYQDTDPCDSDGDGLLDGEDSNGDGDPYNDDCDGDGIPNFQDSDPCDTDGDGITDNDEDNDGDGDPTNDDCDGDGIPDYQDTDVCDTDGDGINDDDEDTDGDGDLDNDDCDGDGTPNYLDTDSCDTDGDGILDEDEDTDGDGNPYNDDCDGDGLPNFQDTDPCDSDGDGLLDGEDSDQNGDPYNDDCDGDGIPNFQDSDPCDTDGDGITDNDEDTDGDGDPTNDDCDNDSIPNYQDADVCDTDGDGINDDDEDTDGDGDVENDDCDGDGTPNYQDTDPCDTDGDGILDDDEDTDDDGDPYNDDCDEDGIPNFQDTDPCDSDGDGLLDGEDSDQDGDPYNDDCDGDGIPNFQDSDPCDTDGDGITDNDEDTDGDGDPTNDDCDNDGTPNYQDADVCDTDGDGINDDDEDTDGDGDVENDDCDGDGTPNYQDTDPCDTDGDGILDDDEDTDGDGNPYNDDCDGDGIPNFQDADPCDSDGDGLLDGEDSDQDGDPYNDDCDGDGIPNFQDSDPCDTDGDGITDNDEDTDGDGDPTNDDCDGDGTPDYQDADVCDTDGDGINDSDEDTDGDGDPTNDDCDGDGTPNFQDTDPCDTDGDGLLDGEDTNGDGNPYNDDCDGDGIPNFQDSDPCDTDGDGITDNDEDTDGDGDPTNDDCDSDGIPNYQDTDPCDSDGDGVLDDDEDTDGDGDPYNDDCDGDGVPNFQDTDPCDTDGDGIGDDDEDTDGDGDPYNDDCDEDGIPNFQDPDLCDQDGDGVSDDDEDTDGDGDLDNDDCDNDGVPNYLDPDRCDTDGDDILDDDEDTDGDGDPYNDDCDGDGIPNFQDTDPCDSDGDGLDDSEEDTNEDGDPYNDDCDEDGIPNFQDADECTEVNPMPGFTPDGNGENDFFYIEGIENYPNNVVQVFNRWGNKLFEVDGYDNQNKVWRGEANFGVVLGGKDVPEGTYFYLIDLGDGSKPLSGYIVIKR